MKSAAVALAIASVGGLAAATPEAPLVTPRAQLAGRQDADKDPALLGWVSGEEGCMYTHHTSPLPNLLFSTLTNPSSHPQSPPNAAATSPQRSPCPIHSRNAAPAPTASSGRAAQRGRSSRRRPVCAATSVTATPRSWCLRLAPVKLGIGTSGAGPPRMVRRRLRLWGILGRVSLVFFLSF